VKQEQRGFPNAGWVLDPVRDVERGALVEVRAAAGDEHVYTFRAVEGEFTPHVWKPGQYSVVVRGRDGRVLSRRSGLQARRG
jgi:hypothetical protein